MNRAEAIAFGEVHYEGLPCRVNPSHGRLRYTSCGACVDCRCGTPAEKALRATRRAERRQQQLAILTANVSDMWRGLRASRRITQSERDALNNKAARTSELLDTLLADWRPADGVTWEQLESLGLIRKGRLQ